MKKLLLALCPIILMLSCNKAETGTYEPPHKSNIPETYFNLSYKGKLYTLYDVTSGTSHTLKGIITYYKIDTVEYTSLKLNVNPPSSNPFTVEMTGTGKGRKDDNIFNGPTFKLTFAGQTTVHASSTFPTNSLEVTDVYGSGDQKYARGAFRFRVDTNDEATGSFRVFYADK